jgi:hypothetical protein
VNLGIGSAEFGLLSTAEFHALERAYRERENHDDWRTAMIVCTLQNLARTKKEDPILTPEKLFPWLAGMHAEAKKKRPKQTPDEMLLMLQVAADQLR